MLEGMRGIFFSWCQHAACEVSFSVGANTTTHAQNTPPFEFDVCRTGFARCTYHYICACGLGQRCSPFKPPKTNRPPERLTGCWGSQKNGDGVAQPQWKHGSRQHWTYPYHSGLSRSSAAACPWASACKTCRPRPPLNVKIWSTKCSGSDFFLFVELFLRFTARFERSRFRIT